ncbi:hypothetical protein TRFO_39448 [Tritrichomonas foetus]|uniref:Uncharacterized protein n=1 Tax=Tritrichomonas foetus TaxID=1144522 RepID=A0A1J4J4Y7_9EUKA|nr:hypothetical protein TRFO_39448 [Tritrichomonas foetus]|eukprot:OHS94382.1 hypothetical protein TRFO_39448 [Tritrichomonas foetus]
MPAVSDPALTTSEPHIKCLKKIILFSGISGIIGCGFTVAINLFYVIITCHSYFQLTGFYFESYLYCNIVMGFICFVFSILMLAFGYKAIQLATNIIFSFLFSITVVFFIILVNANTDSSHCDKGLLYLESNFTKNWDKHDQNPLKSLIEKYHLENIEFENIHSHMVNIIDGYSCRKMFPYLTASSVMFSLYAFSVIALFVYMRAYPDKIGVYTDCCCESTNITKVDYYYGGKKRNFKINLF